MSQEFNLDDFISGINADRSKPKSAKDRLNRVLMNTRKNQGTLRFIPLLIGNTGKPYVKLENVMEYYGDTSVLESGEAWYRVLPIEYYGDLTDEQKDLYFEVRGYLNTLRDSEVCSYDELRVRTYSLFAGVGVRLRNVEDSLVEEIVDAPCIFTYPSKNVIDQFCDAINTKVDNMGGKKEWIPRVISTGETGRRGVVQIKFVKSTGAGYDCSVSFEMNNSDEGITAIDPDYVVSKETMDKFTDLLPTFLGWMYDKDNKSYFNTNAFKELRDQLKVYIKSLENGNNTEQEVKYENKNELKPDNRRPF